ncbi:hypothetical protein SAMN04487869_12641 [Marinobacter sp. DSM 26671]|uniref:hypothetical protein n=1 Tax=Marinobacter sp. DSM 26671 TaxID=1761793 RepID=UPI0008DEFE65|nr:hypothetical protein [Marinobacter sp. DSM 26671]MEC9040741.1 hypothetical protein [Pseudomonadota bacterium]SFE93794.1 hypothetical protein SAMN04487869_12641 [Marinobacter sp. DSM 26671]
MPFLSLLDDRAKPKGSRDPLGFELVWTHFGRKVVGNLTTITSSVENFTVALLGFYWAHQIHGNADKDSRERLIRETFLRYEQLAAYLRYQSGSKEIMGITRVHKNMTAQAGSLAISLKAQILSNQASYGLWGLYSSALKDSGLVEGSDRKLTAEGMDLAATIAQGLNANEFIQLFRVDGQLSRHECERLAPQFWHAIRKETVRQNLTHILLRGRHNQSASVQEGLFAATEKLVRAGKLTGKFSQNLNQVQSVGSPELQKCLEEIQRVERVLVAANNVFYYLLTQDHRPVSSVVEQIESQAYDYEHLPETLPQGMTRRSSLCEINDNLRARNHWGAVSAVIKLNAEVMKARGGAPWVTYDGDILNVKVKSETAVLRSREALLDDWDYDYFLGSYFRIAKANLEERNG